jgi:sodium-dependent phosphate cotransporter
MPASATPQQSAARWLRGPSLTAGRILAVLVLLYVFLFAIALLGAAFKIFGSDFSRVLIAKTTNPVVGLVIGLLATSIIQSSSSTTSIVVGLVAANALTVTNAIPIIMGANMGTTVTNTIVAMASINRRSEFVRAFAGATMHDFFNLLTICILFPLELTTHYLQRTASWLAVHLAGSSALEFHSPIKAAVKPTVKLVDHVLTEVLSLPDWAAGTLMLLLSLGCIFLALAMLTRMLRGIVLRRAEGAFTTYISRSGLSGIFLGTVVTAAVQSSSITTSLLVPMIGAGIISLESAFAVTLGANIGTTVTALLASLAGNLAGVTVALVHLLFNVTGILIIYPFRPLRRIPINLARLLAHRTAKRRIYAFVYMLGVFFVLPLIFVLVTKAV